MPRAKHSISSQRGDPGVEDYRNGNQPIALLTPPEVADLLRVKLPRVYEAVKDRRLRAIKVGRLLRFRSQDVNAFLESHTLSS